MIEQLKTTVCHVKHDLFDTYIGRKTGNYPETMWGNPFVVGKPYTREEAVALYEEYLFTQPRLLCGLPALKGQKLGCWCHPEKCHGNVLADLVNNPRMWYVVVNRITPEIARQMLCIYKDWSRRVSESHPTKAWEVTQEKHRFTIAYNVRVDNEWDHFRLDNPQWSEIDLKAYLGARL